MLTARDAVDDRVAGLDSGRRRLPGQAFRFQGTAGAPAGLAAARHEDLRPRVAARGRPHAGYRQPRGRRAAGRRISLTAKEYALLEFLVLNQGRVVGRERIAEHVWDESFDPFSNVIDVYIKRLRAKLDAGAGRRLIHTRRGEGYISRRRNRSRAMISSFRSRLTAWYLAFFSLLFVLFSLFLYGVLAGALRDRLDETLRSDMQHRGGACSRTSSTRPKATCRRPPTKRPPGCA